MLHHSPHTWVTQHHPPGGEQETPAHPPLLDSASAPCVLLGAVSQEGFASRSFREGACPPCQHVLCSPQARWANRTTGCPQNQELVPLSNGQEQSAAALALCCNSSPRAEPAPQSERLQAALKLPPRAEARPRGLLHHHPPCSRGVSTLPAAGPPPCRCSVNQKALRAPLPAPGAWPGHSHPGRGSMQGAPRPPFTTSLFELLCSGGLGPPDSSIRSNKWLLSPSPTA